MRRCFWLCHCSGKRWLLWPQSTWHHITHLLGKAQGRSVCSLRIWWESANGVHSLSGLGWVFYVHFWNSSESLSVGFSEGLMALEVVMLSPCALVSHSVLFVLSTSRLHSGFNVVISEIQVKSCIYFRGSRIWFCFVWSLVIHNA